MASVTIDGKDYGEVDQYGYEGVHVGRMDQREVPFRWTIADLSPGDHKIEVKMTGEKSSDSNGTEINVTRLSAYQ